ncbi:(2Fe-2S)-binding protein [Humitalea sp. 24SJ18S-53]|uniref:(2Fe-2S)-binding protein n=1 Tax=Humitalea sp. 24SJ18S-53 TaxID=3422307 RepID=UPI003D6715FC
MTTISLILNGKARTSTVLPRDTLAGYLRDGCQLTGTHLGCEHGACGACTVLLDGEPVRSCIVLAVTADAREVQSIEGLRDDAIMVLLRKAFHEAHALQCGFCTPGMLITARDILRRHHAPDETLIRRELAGQICRCTGYVGIVEAIRCAGAELAATPQPIE